MQRDGSGGRSARPRDLSRDGHRGKRHRFLFLLATSPAKRPHRMRVAKRSPRQAPVSAMILRESPRASGTTSNTCLLRAAVFRTTGKGRLCRCRPGVASSSFAGRTAANPAVSGAISRPCRTSAPSRWLPSVGSSKIPTRSRSWPRTSAILRIPKTHKRVGS
jgi:hypothetical protein